MLIIRELLVLRCVISRTRATRLFRSLCVAHPVVLCAKAIEPRLPSRKSASNVSGICKCLAGGVQRVCPLRQFVQSSRFSIDRKHFAGGQGALDGIFEIAEGTLCARQSIQLRSR